MKLVPFKSVVGSRKSGSQGGQTLAMFAFTVASIVSLVAVAIGFGTTQPRPSYTMSLQEIVDAAAQVGAHEFKRNYKSVDLVDAVWQYLSSHGIKMSADLQTPDVDIVIQTCSTAPGDSVLCPQAGEVAKKLVRVKVTQDVMIDSVRTAVTAESIAEEPSLDVVLVIQNSEAMTFQAVDWANRDPSVCNPTSCHPFEEVKAAAKDFVNTLYFPYDRISIVTYNQTASLVLPLDDFSGGSNTADPALTGLTVFSPAACAYTYEQRVAFPNPVSAPVPGYGGIDPKSPCRLYKTDGTYMGFLDCPMFYATDVNGLRTSANDPSWCHTSNTAAGLALAENTLSINGYATSKRVIVLLSTGAPTIAQDGNGDAICPPSTVNPAGFTDYTHSGCRDINVLARHCFQNTDTVCLNTNYDLGGNGNPADFMHGTYDPTNYDAYDRAFDMVDASAANGTNIFTVGLSPQVRAIAADISGFAPGESFLKYAAGATGNIYWYVPDGSGLHTTMLDVAAKIGLSPMAPFSPTSTPTATATSTETATPTATSTSDCALLGFTSTFTQTGSTGTPKIQINILNDGSQPVTITDLSFDWSAYHSIVPSQVGTSWDLSGTVGDGTDFSNSPLNWSGAGPSIAGGSTSTLRFNYKNADAGWPGDVSKSSFGVTVTFDNLCTISVTASPVSTSTPTVTPTSIVTPTSTITPTSTVTKTPTPSGQTFFSDGAEDGWILESSETSEVGGSSSTAGAFRLGDDAANRQYRSVLSFDTSALPDKAVITSVVLKIKQNGPAVGINPFTKMSPLWIDLRKGAFGTRALQISDFSALASLSQAGSFNKTPVSGWYTATLSGAALNQINKTGLTQMRLRFNMGDNNNHSADWLVFYGGDFANPAYRPVLEIKYYIPISTATPH